MPAVNDLSGQVFGRLTVESRAPNHGRRVAWWCRCACGNRKSIQSDSLVGGKTKSCGCLLTDNVEVMSKVWESNIKHGHACWGRSALTPTYRSWSNMLTRCYNPNFKDWDRYGGRGIAVCERWRGPDGFTNFLVDMGERPAGKTLDRYPNKDGNYEPGNCRWATPSEQTRNARGIKLTMEGARQIRQRFANGERIAHIASSLNLNAETISGIVKNTSWKELPNG